MLFRSQIYLFLGVFTSGIRPGCRSYLLSALPVVPAEGEAFWFLEKEGGIARFPGLCTGFYGLVHGKERLGQRSGGQPFPLGRTLEPRLCDLWTGLVDFARFDAKTFRQIILVG